MAKVTRKPVKRRRVMEQSIPKTKQLRRNAKGKKRKNPYKSMPRNENKVKEIQRQIKRLLHERSRKKSFRTSTAIPGKVKRVKKAKKFRPLAKLK
ncbi:spermatid nuclear transition protein 3-like [Fukomys damarensis]|uniref:spermatid nuclear transition protein 3-like n=1 Tax=Fukomys damarensis TaxID=885580 RepID=UPI00053F3F86|nr:spermatid nuclear transition protein 3-like [Fukomys damarensis]